VLSILECDREISATSFYDFYAGILYRGTKSKDRDHDENGKRFNSKVDVRRKIFAVYMDQILLAVNGQRLKENNDYSYEVIIYDPEFRKAALSLTNALRDQGVKTELISKKENISLDEYTTFKKEDGATKITYVSKDGAVEL